MKIRVCWIIPTLDEGGAEKQLCLLASGIDRERFEPFVITLTRGGPREAMLQQASVPIVSINKQGKLDPFAWFRLVRTLKNIAPDVVHTWLFAANSYGRAAAMRAKVPVIFGGERCVDPWKTGYHAFVDRYLAKRTTGLITNSQGVVDFYSRRGIDRGKFHVIPNGIAAAKVTSISREEACRRMNIPSNHFVVGTIGRLWLQKGHQDMIWAGEMLRVAHEHVSLVIIGDGPERGRLEHYRDQVKAARAVRFLGHRSDVAEIMPHFDLYWNASHYEGQSNAVLEAMQAKVPVLASDIPGNRDLVVDHQTGRLFPVGDVGSILKIASQLYGSEEERRRLAERAEQRIRDDFSIEKMIQRHETLYAACRRGS
jgi:glycosyltransferase involved in cell wall biosynthesis